MKKLRGSITLYTLASLLACSLAGCYLYLDNKADKHAKDAMQEFVAKAQSEGVELQYLSIDASPLSRSVAINNLEIKGKEFGARSAQPAWVDYMKIASKNLPIEPFQTPTEIVSVRIDKATGKLTNKTDKSSRLEFFRLGNTPTEYVKQDNSDEILNGSETEADIEQEKEVEEEELF